MAWDLVVFSPTLLLAYGWMDGWMDGWNMEFMQCNISAWMWTTLCVLVILEESMYE